MYFITIGFADYMYPDSFITKAEYDDGELELKLDNGFELKFDKNFNLAGLDR